MADRFPKQIPGVRHTAGIPSITIRGVELHIDTKRLGSLPLGTVDVAVRTVPAGGPVLTGRLVPSLSSAPGASGEIVLSGQESEPGTFDLSASAAGVPISTDVLPKGTELEGLRHFAPHGVLALRAWGVISLDSHAPPHGGARLALTEGGFKTASGESIEDLSLQLRTDYAPASPEDLWNLRALTASVKTTGSWRQVPFEGIARLSSADDPEHLISGQVHVPRLPCTHEIIDLFGDRPEDENLWSALAPRGEVELWAGFDFAQGWIPGEPIGPSLGVACEIGLSGKAGMTYHGFPSQASGKRDQGFPLPIDGMSGGVVYAFDSRRIRPFLVGIRDVEGSPAHGSLQGRGLVTAHRSDAPLDAPGRGYVELDLDIHGKHIANDGVLRSALNGLADAVPPADTWEPYNPTGGEISAALRIVRTVDMSYAATRLSLDLDDASLTSKDLPVPVSRTHGRLEFLSDGRSERGLACRLQGSLRTAADLGLSLRFQTDPSQPTPPSGKTRIDEISYLAVVAHRVSLTGDDEKILVKQVESIRSAMTSVAPQGFADVTYAQVRPGPGPRKSITAEVEPREATLTPVAFKIPAGSVRGRVLVNIVEEKPDGETRSETIVSPLVATLAGDMQVAVMAAFPPGTIRIHGGGLDPANPSLLGALGQTMRSTSGAEGPDLAALSVEGALDVDGTIVPAGDTSSPGQQFRLFLRENSLQTSKSFRLDRLEGVLELHGDKVLLGHEIRASLAGTMMELAELRYAPVPDGFELTTRIKPVERLPLDRDHLRAFMDEATLDALLGPLGWRGQLDVQEGHLRILLPHSGNPRLEFDGDIALSDMQVQLGLPFSIQSASASIEKLVYENGSVRGMCRVRDLYGRIADRKLDKASMLITYVEPRLSIESIEGELEGGSIRPLGSVGARSETGAERGGTAFSIDLEEPLPFQLALDLRGVDLAGLTRGLFATSFATHGKLNGQLRLTGDTRRLLGIQGSGSLQIFDSRLWSVPVFRALFSQLGLDDKLVFDQIGANLRIRNGVMWTDDISIHSPILELVGKGSIDFDGGLTEELQVRYGLIDRLGPLTRILYAIQKQLLSVAIRGDLGRPRVILRNPWTSVSAENGRYRSLPLPGLSPLPPRF
jgi:hypothetical protein